MTIPRHPHTRTATQACEEYVQLVGLGEGSYAAAEGRAADLAQTDMAFKAAVPLLEGDEANFITGLAIDYSNAVLGGWYAVTVGAAEALGALGGQVAGWGRAAAWLYTSLLTC